MIREIRERLTRQPFIPFTIHLADSRTFDVPHPEFLWLEVSQLYYIHGADPVGERINSLLIVSIGPMASPRKRRRR